MSHPLEGVTRVINLTAASAGAGATDLDLRPAAGMVWELLMAVAYQDDGLRSQQWLMTDPDTTDGVLATNTAAGAYDRFQPGTGTVSTSPPAHIAAPFILTYNRYLTYRFDASAGAKNSVIYAVVKEYRGVSTEA